MMRNPRPLLALALLLAAVFMAHPQTCGIIGYWLAHGCRLLFGSYGSQLVLWALVIGAACVGVPRWIVKGTARALARTLKSFTRRRGARTVTYVPLLPASTVAANDTKSVPVLPPQERMKLDEVRGVLKSLQYKPNEFEPVVAGMDPALPLDTLVRQGLAALRKPGLVS